MLPHLTNKKIALVNTLNNKGLRIDRRCTPILLSPITEGVIHLHSLMFLMRDASNELKCIQIKFIGIQLSNSRTEQADTNAMEG